MGVFSKSLQTIMWRKGRELLSHEPDLFKGKPAALLLSNIP